MRTLLLSTSLLALGLLAIRSSAPGTDLPLFAQPGQQGAARALRPELARVRLEVDDALRAFEEHTAAYAKTARTAPTAGALRDAHRTARRAFKRVEWLLAHLDEEGVKRGINGAPLPSVEQRVPEVRILEPMGFQRLEELVYEEPLDAAEVGRLTRALARDADRQIRAARSRTLTTGLVLDAARYGVIRVATLGITGFDAPASGEAVTESAVALAAIRRAVRVYGREAAAAPALGDRIDRTFARGVETLRAAPSFAEFDRIEFLRDVVDPLYADLPRLREAILGESGREPREHTAHNPLSTSLFADDFLDEAYFAGQPAEDSLFSRKRDLGERLFFETKLSASGTLACASCHEPDRAFTDGRKYSPGKDGHLTKRNTPTLLGAVFAERYFGDLRESRLAGQIRQVMLDEHEFANDFVTLVARISAEPAYADAFDSAYADLEPRYRISTHSLADALASYVRTLHSNSSPVDAYLRGETDELAASVRRGANLFMGEAACGTCHFAPTFAGLVPPYFRESESEVLGTPARWPVVDTAELHHDAGRYASGRPEDTAPFYTFSFKTPTVRNVASTAPYMHHGAFATLDDVVDFYDAGGGTGIGLDVPYQTLPPDSLHLDAQQRSDLVAFMEALSDRAIQ